MALKIYLPLIFLFLALKGYTQQNSVYLTPYGAVGVNVLVGNLEKFYRDNARSPVGDLKPAGRATAGIQISYMTTDQIGVTTGIGYDISAWKFEASNSRTFKTTSQERIQIPLLFRWQKINPKKRGGYFFQIGGNVSLLQGIKDNIYGPINQSILNEFNEVTYALQINTGGIAHINRHLSGIVALDAQQQLNNNFSRPDMKGRLSSIAFCVGLSVRP